MKSVPPNKTQNIVLRMLLKLNTNMMELLTSLTLHQISGLMPVDQGGPAKYDHRRGQEHECQQYRQVKEQNKVMWYL